MAVVYILRGACGRHYIGFTEALDRRLEEHRRGSNPTYPLLLYWRIPAGE